ncbi:DUF418 domain-containing protein [Roseibacterium sp. SDUM158016]|uniref:DUF418 domain-containing protein n=1 Tax=Roseicyclus sediminis TaxID=2980997 RepID=UPI0021D31801|nr:DUF418 domain-containing protein [Roseibacterium sp. SDUM158016]MCU4652875.1 DUF418 domain-containing protein [Roseibacterium sp. SDUM158016]
MSPSRAPEVDLLRAVALYGICIANIPYLALPFDALAVPPSEGIDRLAAIGSALLVHGKFFVLFSFLFGWGFGVQLAAAERRGRPARETYLRRLAGLLVIGIAHAFLVFAGDILILYAILGLVLWTLRNASDQTLRRIAMGSVVVAALAYAIVGAALTIPLDTILSPEPSGYLGGFNDALAQRAGDWVLAFPFVLLFNGPLAFGAFALGLLAHRHGFLEPGSAAFARLERAIPWLLLVAIPANAAYAATVTSTGLQALTGAAGWACLAVGSPALASVYLWATVRLARTGSAGDPGMGRVSLSGYILQGIVAGLIFNGLGLGLHGQFGLAALVAMAVLVAVIVDVALRVWLRFFRTGPFEAVLRRITYGPA